MGWVNDRDVKGSASAEKNMAVGPLPPAADASFHQLEDDGGGLTSKLLKMSTSSENNFRTRDPTTPCGPKQRDCGKRTMGVGLTPINIDDLDINGSRHWQRKIIALGPLP